MSKCTQELVEKIEHFMIDEGFSQRKACELCGVPESTYRSWRDSGKTLFEKSIAGGSSVRPDQRRKELRGKRFVFTSAQNNSFVHERDLRTLEHYCEYTGAKLVVGTLQYTKNRFHNESEEDIWYDPKIVPYIMDESCEVFEGLLWCGELKISPTASNPLSGFDTYTKECSGIIPHTSFCMKPLPVFKGEVPKQLYTTGCITKANYIKKKEGQKAEFHHVYGAVVAEVDEDGDWFVRPLHFEGTTGNLQDLDLYITPDGEVSTGNRVEAINYGDIHSEKPDEVLYEATFGEGGLLDYLKPKYQFMNDTLDFTIRNHHNIKNSQHRHKWQVARDGKDLVEDDVKRAVKTLQDAHRDWCKTVVVESNHDLALAKWLEEGKPELDNVWNAHYYYKLRAREKQAVIEQDYNFSIFEWCCGEIDPRLDVTFLREDDSFIIAKNRRGKGGIQCGSHGHNGTNGARGSVAGFSKAGQRVNLGHIHSAWAMGGAYSAGIKGNMDQGYNKGMTTWSQSDVVTYPNGKRATIQYKNGKYKA